MQRRAWLAMMFLGVTSMPGAADVDPLKDELHEKELPVDQPLDFISLLARADAMAARQHASFKLYQVEIVFSFPGGTPRTNHIDFHYARPAPTGGDSRPRWEELR